MFLLLQSKKIQAQLKELRYGKKDLLFKVSVFLPFPFQLSSPILKLSKSLFYWNLISWFVQSLRVLFNWNEDASTFLPHGLMEMKVTLVPSQRKTLKYLKLLCCCNYFNSVLNNIVIWKISIKQNIYWESFQTWGTLMNYRNCWPNFFITKSCHT
jgi:hypothetical protein